MGHNPDCIFCKIATGQIPKDFVYQDDELMVFADIHPAAPVHLLVVPREHILRSVADLEPGQETLLSRMLVRAKVIAEQQGIADNGYRLVFNVRKHAGQEVDHIHLHLLGGRRLGSVA